MMTIFFVTSSGYRRAFRFDMESMPLLRERLVDEVEDGVIDMPMAEFMWGQAVRMAREEEA